MYGATSFCQHTSLMARYLRVEMTQTCKVRAHHSLDTQFLEFIAVSRQRMRKTGSQDNCCVLCGLLCSLLDYKNVESATLA